MKFITLYILAIASGLLIGLASPAIDWWYLGFIALIPFYHGIIKSKSYNSALLLGFICGIIATGIITWPLTSASTWVGWAEYTREQSATHQSSYSTSLLMIWVLLTFLGGGVLFSLFSALLKYLLSKKLTLTLLFAAPVFWLLIVEYGRNLFFFDYEWMPIGSLFIHLPWLAQLAAYGGVWLLGAIVVFINGLLYLALFSRVSPSRKMIATALGITALIILTTLGTNRYKNLEISSETTKPIKVATIQFSKGLYTENDYTPFYMDKHYLRLLKSAYEKFGDKFDIMVLPESIGFGNVSLDGTKSKTTPDKTLSTIQQWYDAIKPLILKESLLIFGTDTVVKGENYNSILAWNKTGPIWKYHKQRLVPFAESIPDYFTKIGPKSQSSYQPGLKTNNLKLNNVNIGFFICQEALFPDITKKSVMEGAEFLITVGNDGVFKNLTIAKNNHVAARFRAIESGRYIVRAMKNGISSIITPTGDDKIAIQSNENGLISSKVFPLTEITPYTRFYDYILWLLLGAAVLLFIIIAKSNSSEK